MSSTSLTPLKVEDKLDDEGSWSVEKYLYITVNIEVGSSDGESEDNISRGSLASSSTRDTAYEDIISIRSEDSNSTTGTASEDINSIRSEDRLATQTQQ